MTCAVILALENQIASDNLTVVVASEYSLQAIGELPAERNIVLQSVETYRKLLYGEPFRSPANSN